MVELCLSKPHETAKPLAALVEHNVVFASQVPARRYVCRKQLAHSTSLVGATYNMREDMPSLAGLELIEFSRGYRHVVPSGTESGFGILVKGRGQANTRSSSQRNTSSRSNEAAAERAERSFRQQDELSHRFAGQADFSTPHSFARATECCGRKDGWGGKR